MYYRVGRNKFNRAYDVPPTGVKLEEWLHYFVPLLGRFRKQLLLSVVAMMMDALLTVLRPWPLKVVIDRVLSHKATRVPFVAHFLNDPALDRMAIVYGACATTLLIALSTGI